MELCIPWPCLAVLGWLIGVHGEEESSAKCRQNAVVMAMTRCQGERHHLSLASQTNNTKLLCRALQQYSDCMEPRIRGCQGPAKMAFDVITSKYAGPPYNCHLQDTTDTVAYHDNEAKPPSQPSGENEVPSPDQRAQPTNELPGQTSSEEGEPTEEVTDTQGQHPEETYRLIPEDTTPTPATTQPPTGADSTPTDSTPTGGHASSISPSVVTTSASKVTRKVLPPFDPSRGASSVLQYSAPSLLLGLLLLYLT